MRRARWDWLADLVAREAIALGRDDTRRRPALRDAITGLGFRAESLIEGLAVALQIAPDALRRPEPAVVLRTEPARLAAVLSALLDHPDAHLVAIAEGWLACREVAYQLPPSTLARWLQSRRAVAERLRDRLPREGLALLGPDRLRRLAEDALDPATREAAQQWVQRLE